MSIPANELFPDVEESSDFLVYFVVSETFVGRKYRVDLERGNTNGFCECKSFCAAKNIDVGGVKMTMRQALEQRAMPNEQLECKHIKRVKRYLLFKILNEIIERRNNEAENNKREARKSKLVQGVPKAMEEAQSGIEVYADSQANVAGIERQGSNSEADEHPF